MHVGANDKPRRSTDDDWRVTGACQGPPRRASAAGPGVYATARGNEPRESGMGLIDFVKDAGEKLFGRGSAQAAMADAKTSPGDAAKSKAANDAAGEAIAGYI